MEIYKDIKGYEGIYQISNAGNVKSLKFGKEKIIKEGKDKDGYLYFNLYKESIATTFKIHRQVAVTFISNPYNLPQVNHKDLNKLNNNYWNLEWTSNIENQVHRFIGKKTTSSYCGVYWDKVKERWRARILFNGKRKHLGLFINEIDAYNARVEFEKNNGIINKYL